MGETMKIYFSITKSYALMLCVTMLVCFAMFSCVSVQQSNIHLSSESARISYLSSMGFNSPDLQESKSVILPLGFSESFEQYTDIMEKGGYGISEYKGEEVMLYTYFFSYDIVHLIEFEDRLICADCFNMKDNKIYPLKVRKNG